MGVEWGLSLWFGFVFLGWPMCDIEHLSMYLLAICASSLENIQILCPFLNGVVCVLNFELCTFHVLDKNFSSDN